MRIITLNTKKVLLNRIQCMRDSLKEIDDNIIALINQRNLCCSASPSTSPDSLCSTAISSGGEGVQVDFITLGLSTGVVYFNYDAATIPDKFVVEWNNVVVIDTGYVGEIEYNSVIFNATGQNITGPGIGVAQFNKNLSNPSVAKVTVYGPLNSTGWGYTLSCPGQAPIPSVSSTSSAPLSPSLIQWSDSQSVQWSDGQNIEFS